MVATKKSMLNRSKKDEKALVLINKDEISSRKSLSHWLITQQNKSSIRQLPADRKHYGG